MSYSIIVVLLLFAALSSIYGYFTPVTKIVEESSSAIAIGATIPASSMNGNIAGSTIEEENALTRMKRRLKTKKIDKDCLPTMSATDEGLSMLDDYGSLKDDPARKIEAEYKWSVVGKHSAAEGEMNSFIDDYVEQFDHLDKLKHKTVNGKKRILNVIISDVTDDKKIVISNKNYTVKK